MLPKSAQSRKGPVRFSTCERPVIRSFTGARAEGFGILRNCMVPQASYSRLPCPRKSPVMRSLNAARKFMAGLPIAYANVSSNGRDATSQMNALRSLGLPQKRAFTEPGLSGANRARPVPPSARPICAREGLPVGAAFNFLGAAMHTSSEIQCSRFRKRRPLSAALRPRLKCAPRGQSTLVGRCARD